MDIARPSQPSSSVLHSLTTTHKAPFSANSAAVLEQKLGFKQCLMNTTGSQVPKGGPTSQLSLSTSEQMQMAYTPSLKPPPAPKLSGRNFAYSNYQNTNARHLLAPANDSLSFETQQQKFGYSMKSYPPQLVMDSKQQLKMDRFGAGCSGSYGSSAWTGQANKSLNKSHTISQISQQQKEQFKKSPLSAFLFRPK